MERFAVAAVLVVVAVGVALLLRRRAADAPIGPRQAAVPAVLDRTDFTGAGSPWLVVVFTSRTCHTCAAVVAAAQPLASATVAVEEVAFQDRRALHQRYAVDSVPLLVVADADGVVRHHVIGPVEPGQLWSGVVEVVEGGGAGTASSG